MSGIEVAGLILGAFPLLICAIDSTKEISRLKSTWRNVRKEYRRCINDLRVQHAFYQLNLKELLLPLIPDEEENLLNELLAEPGCAAWKREDLTTKLDRRLPAVRDEYLETMIALNGALEDLGEELGFSKKQFQGILLLDTSISDRKNIVKSHVQREYLKLKFSLGRSARGELLNTVSRYNRQLQDLLNRCDAVSALENVRRKPPDGSKVDPKLAEFHQHADSLYSLLRKSLVCECKSKHSVQLLLRHRKPIDYDFNILFLFSGKASLSPLWTSRETQIKMVDMGKPNVFCSEASPSVEGETRAGLSVLGQAKKRTVQQTPSLKKIEHTRRMNATTPERKVAFSMPLSPPSSPMPNSSGTREATEIKDLCHSMASLDSACFGVLKDGQRHYAIYPKPQLQSSTDQREMVPLRSLLDGSFGMQLTRKQRFYVALILSSSYLQLHTTQWLAGNRWTKEDILFPLQSENKIISVVEPYISKHLADISSGGMSSSRPEPSFALLGIMLLELIFNETLENHDKEKRYVAPDGKRNLFLSLAAALEWAEEAVDDAGPEFADAVKWCLRQSSRSTDGKWRKELLENVLEPLQMCYNFFDKSSRF